MLSIEGVTFAHSNAKPLGQVLCRAAKGRVVCDQQQTTATAYPIMHGFAFLFSESWTICAFIIHLFSAYSVGNYEDLEGFQRLFAESLSIDHNSVTIADDQVRERLVATGRSMKIVVCF